MHKDKNKRTWLNLLGICCLIFSLLFLSGCLLSNFSKGSVEGYIHEETIIDTRPLEGALVSITGSSNTALTDSEGYFLIDEITIGSRTLTITKGGYIPYKKSSILVKEEETTLVNDGLPLIVQAEDEAYLFNSGVIYYDLEDYANALDAFQQLIDEYPESEYADDAKYYIGFINEKILGYYSKALIEYYELIYDLSLIHI